MMKTEEGWKPLEHFHEGAQRAGTAGRKSNQILEHDFNSRWRNLRDVLAEEKMKLLEDVMIQEAAWKHFKLMSFQEPFINRRSTERNKAKYISFI